jgi:hypothetical protein
MAVRASPLEGLRGQGRWRSRKTIKWQVITSICLPASSGCPPHPSWLEEVRALFVVSSNPNVDALERHDITVARETEPGAKLEQALELMAVGFRLKLDALRSRRPDASEAELRVEFEQWLSDGD